MTQMKIDQELLKDFLHMMLRIRMFEEGLVEPILQNETRTPCHLYSGEEAIAAGMCAALEQEDYIFGNHRSHGHFLAKGGSMKEMAAEIFCRETGCCKGRGGSMHVIDPSTGMMGAAPIVAGTISLAVGAALASSIRKDGRVSVSFFGDGATGEGVLYESMNLAALKRLPVIFACENNLYATHMPIRECRVDQPISRIAEPFCMEIHTVDGNDVLKVYEEAGKAAETCRNGNGPVFMEFLTYRFRGHVGPDDNIQGAHTDIRPVDEIEQWRQKDPILRLERHLLDNRIMDEAQIGNVRREVEQEVEEAIEFAKASAFPKAGDMGKYVFKKQ
jgi:acetoin:2,6-dichlorophenolindophenol oxidoreductase subunit alpha